MATIVFNDEFTISTKDTKIFIDITSGENYVWIPAAIQISSITGTDDLFTIGTGDITLQLDFTKSLAPPVGTTRTPYIESVADLIDSTLIAGTFNILVRGSKLTQWRIANMTGFSDNVSTIERTLTAGLPINGINFITFPTGATNMAIASTSTDDVGVTGIGCRSVTIDYTDISYDTFQETITLDGTTPVFTVNPMFRINRMTGITAGSTGTNQGEIYIGVSGDTFTGGAPDTEIFHILGSKLGLSNCGTLTLTGDRNYPITVDSTSNVNVSKPLTIKTFLQQPGRLRVQIKEDHFSTAGPLSLTTDGVQVQPKGTNIELIAYTTVGKGRANMVISFYEEDEP